MHVSTNMQPMYSPHVTAWVRLHGKNNKYYKDILFRRARTWSISCSFQLSTHIITCVNGVEGSKKANIRN